MKLILSNKILLQSESLDILQDIKTRLSLQNPAWTENDRMGRWNGDTPPILRFYEDDSSGLLIPRGFLRQLISMVKRSGEPYEFEDRRRILPSVDFTFNGQLRPFQQEAVKAMRAYDFGTLAAPTGSGKTIMALAMIAQRRQPALIITHTKELLNQWISRIEQFLQIPSSEIGKIGDGKRIIGGKITVALVQSLYKFASEVCPHIGYLIIDECHRTPSRTFTEAVSAFDCQYMLGLSATPWRRDGLSRLIFWYIGDVVHEVSRPDLIENGDILSFEVVSRETQFEAWSDPTDEYPKMLTELTEDEPRNLLIADDVSKEAHSGEGISLVLSDRKAHCERLQRLLSSRGIRAHLLTGDLGNRERKRVVQDLNAGRVKVLCATGQLIGEGFDCRSLSTLFLATPIKFDGRVLQYLGRVLRPAPGKEKAKVYDYVDSRVGVLKASAMARRRLYGNQQNA